MYVLWTLLLILLASSSVCAQDETRLEEVVVTATRYEEKLADVPSNISVITEEDIKNSPAQDVPDLLRAEAGIHVYDIGGNRRNMVVDLRGFGETAPLNTLVLVDGRRINQADLSGVDWSQIPIGRVKRIEIIRGGRGSVLYGDNAAGGVINIITQEGEAFKGGADLSGGSYGTFKGSAHVSAVLNNISSYLSAAYLTSDGYRDNSATEAKDFGMNTNYTLKDFMNVRFSFGYHKDETGLPGALKESDFKAGKSRTDSTHPHDFIDVEDYYFQLSPEVYFLGDSVCKIDASYRKRAFLSFSSGDWGNFTGDSHLETVIVSPQILLKNDIGKSKNTMLLGFDYQKTDNAITNDSLFFSSRTIGKFDLDKENYGFYIHDELIPIERLRFSGGYRHDRAEFTFEPGKPSSTAMEKDLYTAGINYTFYKNSYVYLSFSRSFRYPVIDELYSFFTNTVNTKLLPQTSDNYEVGTRYYFSEGIYAHFNLFRIDTEDEIFFNPVSYQNENLNGATRRNGVEISLGAKMSEWLTLKGQYTYTDAIIQGGTFEGKDIPNVPRNILSLEADASPGKGFTIVVNGVYISQRPFVSDFSNAFNDQKSYMVFNSKIQYLWKSLTAYLDIYNLTDKKYSEIGSVSAFPAEKAFYPSATRNFLAGLKVNF